MIDGQATNIDKARICIAINGRKPLNISVNDIWGGATDFR